MADTVVVAPAADASVAELETEAAGDAAQAAVEIARINAERDIVVETLHTDANVAQTEARVAADIALAPVPGLEERLSECLRLSETTQMTVQELQAGQRSILERLEALQPPPPPPPPADDANAVTLDNQEAPPAPVKPKPKFKLI